MGKGLVPALVHRGEQFYLSVSKSNATPLSWTQSATHYVFSAQIFTLTAGMTPHTTPPHPSFWCGLQLKTHWKMWLWHKVNDSQQISSTITENKEQGCCFRTLGEKNKWVGGCNDKGKTWLYSSTTFLCPHHCIPFSRQTHQSHGPIFSFTWKKAWITELNFRERRKQRSRHGREISPWKCTQAGHKELTKTALDQTSVRTKARLWGQWRLSCG